MTTTVTAPHVAVACFNVGGSSIFFLLHLIFHHVLVQHGEMSHDPPLLMWKKGTSMLADLYTPNSENYT